MLNKIENFHQEVSKKSAEFEEINYDRINCKKGCSDCCVDDITVFTIEAEIIKEKYSNLLKEEKPNKGGKCAFLNKNEECRIYDHRPYVCRTQGLPLSWIEELEDGNLAEMRDVCPLNDKSSPLEEMESEKFWVIGPHEQKLFELQMEFSNGNPERIRLRDLFE